MSRPYWFRVLSDLSSVKLSLHEEGRHLVLRTTYLDRLGAPGHELTTTREAMLTRSHALALATALRDAAEQLP